MNSEELYNKLTNNEFIEEGVGWNNKDSYYCENQDTDLIRFLKMNMDSDFSIKNIVFTLYQVLKKRYHNNFYLEFVPSQEELIFILRGQPVLKDINLNIIVKYSLIIQYDNCTLKHDFIKSDNADFEYEINYVDNYNKTNQINEIIDNSDSIKLLLDSISLRNYVNKINSNNTPPSVTEKPKAETIAEPEKTNVVDKTTESVIYCPNCGEANYSLNRKCNKCNSTLVSYITAYGNEITSYDEILCEDAIKKIEKTKIPQEFYEYIIETITKKCKKIDFSDDINVFDQILHITRKFVNVRFAYKPEKTMYGEYIFDTVHINSNQPISQQCSSLIRYLSIEIHLEIMEAIFMYIFDVKNNAILRSFIDFCRFTDLYENIIHNYYPIQVEAHYIPEEYHSYDKINDLYNYSVSYEKRIDNKTFETYLILGNTFAQEIIKILDKVITDEMKEKLAEEFIYDKAVPVKEKTIHIQEVLGYEEFIKAIKTSMIKTIKKTMENENSRNNLIENQQKFEGKGNSI